MKLFSNRFALKRRVNYALARTVQLFWNPYKVEIPNGNCPVQCEGFLPTGEWYYFRSRWNRWYVVVAESEKHWEQNDLIFGYEDFFKDEYIGGWITPLHAYWLLNRGLKQYYSKKS